MDENRQLTTPTVDLFAPSDRFSSSRRLYGKLHRWTLLLRRSWWLVALALVVILVPVYFLTAETLPAYESKAKLWIKGRLNIAEGRSLYTEELIDYLSTQAELLRSSAIQGRALAKVEARFPQAFSDPSPGSNTSAVRLVGAVRSFLSRVAGPEPSATNAPEPAVPFKLKIAEGSKSSLLELRATGRDPGATQAYLNSVIDEYFAFKRENREKASDHTVSSVTSEIRELAKRLEAQQEKLHAFQISNNAVFLQEQGNSAASYLAQLNRQIAALRTQLNLLERLAPEQWVEAELQRTARRAEDPQVEAASRDMIASLAGPQAELFKASQQVQLLKAKRAELARFLRPLHPKIIKLDEEVATQERLVQISRDEALSQLANRRQALQVEIKNLEAAFQEWDVKAVESSRKIADYDRLRADLQRLQASYDRLLGVVQNVDMGKTVDQENIGVLEGASVARPIPRMMVNTLLGCLAAFVLSFATLYFLGLFDDRFASINELSNYLSEEVLGQIPAIALKRPNRKRGLEIKFVERQRFEFLESFRNLRSSLMLMGNSETRPKTILITSSVPEEGKSTTSLYLAVTLAMANSKVLLIDGDMRRASLHKSFSAEPSPGLAEILSGKAGAEVIVPTGMTNLALLPAGAARKNPGEMILSSEWEKFIGKISSRYDYILVDSPPVLAADDAAALAPKVDGVIVVVRGSFTSARMAQRALDLLKKRQARVLGLVFNRALSSAYEYVYYKRYGKEYSWRPERPRRAAALACSAAKRGTERQPG
jgi:polysaccharide biosynthesis transport protein